MPALRIYIIVYIFELTLASKILLAPFPYSSHVSELIHIGDELISKKHEVHIMLSESYPQIEKFRKTSQRLPLHEYRHKYDDFYLMDESDSPMTDIIGLPPMVDFRTNTVGFEEFCYNALEDEPFLKNIKSENFDLAVVDAFPTSRCYYIIMYRLGIPYVSVTTQFEPWLYRVPALPSFVPFGLGSPAKSQEMTFFERLSNFYSMLDWSAFPGISYLDDSLVAKYAPEMPFVTLDWLAGQSLLWLIDTDISLDYPRPMMPNEVNIGGLSTKNANSLSQELQKFVEKSSNGVIIASFGSLDILKDEMVAEFLKAYAVLPQAVIMRYEKDAPKDLVVPPNVKLMKWMPQNDLLGHDSVKLFISHGGANSQFEALFHGVPMVIFPLFGDQFYNAKRGEYKGYSITMDIRNFTARELVSNIQIVLNKESQYQSRIQKGSQIFRSAVLNPRQRALFWIEHVMQYGGKHMRSYALDMSWYQYLMLDILALLLFSVLLVGFIMASCLKIIINACFSRQNQKLKTS